MLPHEAALAVASRSERRMQAQLTQVALQGFDRTDTAEWRQLADDQSRRRAPSGTSRADFAAASRDGRLSLGRRDILAHIVGMELLNRPAAAPPPRRSRPQRPASGRGDVAGAPAGNRRRSEADADVALLRGITAADI